MTTTTITPTTPPTAGIYARKSLFTGKGESIQNQINMCTDYAASKGWQTRIYTDEGYSGGSTDRPAFRQMLKDIDSGHLQNVVFYRLDRISRRILDICEFIETLNAQNIGFISLTENFDTTSPLGRAMVHIAATFAQLEREMLAQRVKDNMVQLARTGRWLGGTTPTGYVSRKVTYLTEELKKKSLFVLEEVSGELETVALLFDKYLSLGSLHALEKYCMAHGIRSKNGKDFTKTTLRAILTNAVYIKADRRAFDYFSEQGIQIANEPEDFDGVFGLFSYNKNIEKKGQGNKLREKSQWIMAVGRHRGIVDSDKWIRVQELLESNRHKAPRSGTGVAALLSGLLRCGKCGGFMRIKYGQMDKKEGRRIGYYVCGCKDVSGGALCDNGNIRADILEALVEEKILSLAFSRKLIFKTLERQDKELPSPGDGTQDAETVIREKEGKISNLLDCLEGEGQDAAAVKRIKQRIERLEMEIVALRDKCDEVKKPDEMVICRDRVDLTYLKEAFTDFYRLYGALEDFHMRRSFVLSILDGVVWKDGTVEIFAKGVSPED